MDIPQAFGLLVIGLLVAWVIWCARHPVEVEKE